MTEKKASKDKYIFISYSHHELPEVAEQIKIDLEKDGYEVFLDKNRLKTGQYWDVELVEGLERLKEGGWFLYLMTPSSVRHDKQDKNYCLNEVTWADYHTQNAVLPLRLKTCEPPLTIYRIQYYPIEDCIHNDKLKQDRYLEHLKEIRAILEREKTIPIQDSRIKLEKILNPMEFERKKITMLENFTGREWVLENIKDWLQDPNGQKVYRISGGPGTGKSAIAAWLVQELPQNIKAVHFCDRDNADKSDVNRIIKSIACQLAFVLEDYGELLKERVFNDEDRYKDPNLQPRILFEELIIDLIVQLKQKENDFKREPLVMLVDALDEAGVQGQENELTKLIGDPELQRSTPDWIRWIVTARNEPALNFQLQGIPIQIDFDKVANQIVDFRSYYERRLSDFLEDKEKEELLNILVNKAEKSFLYCQLMSEEILKDPKKLKDPYAIPNGMNGFLVKFFMTQFPEGFDEQTEKTLSLMAAAIEPLDEKIICDITSMSKLKLKKWKRKVGSLIRSEGEKNKVLKFYHSIVREWLINKVEGADPDIYEIEPEEGHPMLADYGWKLFQEEKDWGETAEYGLKYLGVHLYASKIVSEKDEKIINKLLQLLSSTFNKKGNVKLMLVIIDKLINYVVENYQFEKERLFKKSIEKFMEVENTNAKHLLRLFLKIYSSQLAVQEKKKWAKWMRNFYYNYDSMQKKIDMTNELEDNLVNNQKESQGKFCLMSKKDFLNALICPMLAWRSYNQRDLNNLSFEQEYRFYIEDLLIKKAREQFPNGKMISETNNQSVITRTKMELENAQNGTYFEAAFEANDFIAKVDILRKTGDSYHIIEVKSSTVKDLSKAEGRESVEDLAYTVWVAKKAGLNVEKASLWFLSKEYRFGEDTSKLFKIIDATDLVEQLFVFFELKSKGIKIMLQNTETPIPVPIRECRRCPFNHECFPFFDRLTIYSIPRLRLVKHLEAGRFTVQDMMDEKINDSQKRVVDAVITKKTFIDKVGIRNAFKKLQYPIAYFDFETVSPPIPVIKDTKSYERIPYQYSIHIAQNEDQLIEDYEHREYLADPKDMEKSITELANRMADDLDDCQTIVAYHDSFEKGVTKWLAQWAENHGDFALSEKLNAIMERFVDLKRVIQENYYDPKFKGSFSKMIYSVLVPELNYNNLIVRNGNEATSIFLIMLLGREDELEAKGMKMPRRQDLLDYCKMDTWTEVVMMDALKKLISK